MDGRDFRREDSASRLWPGMTVKGFLYHNATTTMGAVKVWNGAGTKRARIAGRGGVGFRSLRHLGDLRQFATIPEPAQRRWRGFRRHFVNGDDGRRRAGRCPPAAMLAKRRLAIATPEAGFLYHSATLVGPELMNRNESGTKGARIAARNLYGFVHGDTWEPAPPQPPNKVAGGRFRPILARAKVNAPGFLFAARVKRRGCGDVRWHRLTSKN